MEEQTSGVQRLVQASSHAERLRLFERMVANEKNRLLARKRGTRGGTSLASLEDRSDEGTRRRRRSRRPMRVSRVGATNHPR